MKLCHLTLLLCVSLSLTGCSALLERNYATVEPHSSKFWESEAAGTLRAESYQDVVNDVLLVAANVCLIGSFAVFVLARVSLAADVYFIPVNYPASEATALHISIVGAVCYLVGIVTLIVEGFSAKN